ncbi:fluoride efflux transporter CrcB [Celerinatantimonas yamalensis]|uniref:Fluoride-specific ion channel FluC n=1 Tax=Celerinatantimonas yamalensis TaxID=559956 RepID=A0ABW9G6X6_9GAMM
MFATLIAVFIGGGCGSMLRWFISLKLNSGGSSLPLGTLAVNMLGAFIIAVGITIFAKMPSLDPTWKLMITTGFCGGLTTFSTFTAETLNLFQLGKYATAISNMALNLAGSMAMAALAFALMSWLMTR